MHRYSFLAFLLFPFLCFGQQLKSSDFSLHIGVGQERSIVNAIPSPSFGFGLRYRIGRHYQIGFDLRSLPAYFNQRRDPNTFSFEESTYAVARLSALYQLRPGTPKGYNLRFGPALGYLSGSHQTNMRPDGILFNSSLNRNFRLLQAQLVVSNEYHFYKNFFVAAELHTGFRFGGDSGLEESSSITPPNGPVEVVSWTISFVTTFGGRLLVGRRF